MENFHEFKVNIVIKSLLIFFLEHIESRFRKYISKRLILTTDVKFNT